MDKLFDTVLSVENRKKVSTASTSSPEVYDYSQCGRCEEVLAPNKGTQVLLASSGKKEPTQASRIYYRGELAGVAMPGPASKDMESVFKMLVQENAGICVDLISAFDRTKERGKTRFDYGSLKENVPKAFGADITVTKSDEKEVRFGMNVESAREGVQEARAIVRTIKIKHPGVSRKFARFHSRPGLMGTPFLQTFWKNCTSSLMNARESCGELYGWCWADRYSVCDPQITENGPGRASQ